MSLRGPMERWRKSLVRARMSTPGRKAISEACRKPKSPVARLRSWEWVASAARLRITSPAQGTTSPSSLAPARRASNNSGVTVASSSHPASA